jgi:hypothetical protein
MGHFVYSHLDRIPKVLMVGSGGAVVAKCSTLGAVWTTKKLGRTPDNRASELKAS